MKQCFTGWAIYHGRQPLKVIQTNKNTSKKIELWLKYITFSMFVLKEHKYYSYYWRMQTHAPSWPRNRIRTVNTDFILTHNNISDKIGKYSQNSFNLTQGHLLSNFSIDKKSYKSQI